ncbi:thioredoxin domain-containing protein [Baekduia soli]|uniref:hypothetical protein n=1 Tax=Baekduia soli TaxID=496014 RepID=UPI0016528013|nr:hypothetical protein [Baekduia soli]
MLDDPGLVTWDAYAVRAWPTLVLVDAEGRVALTVSGEGHAVTLASAIEALVEEAQAAGTLSPGGSRSTARRRAPGSWPSAARSPSRRAPTARRAWPSPTRGTTACW